MSSVLDIIKLNIEGLGLNHDFKLLYQQVFTVADMWVLTLREMGKFAVEPSPLLRHNATHILGR